MATKRKVLLSQSFRVKISPEELDNLKKQVRSTTCRNLSEYIRDLINRKPISVRYRNQSLDEFLLIALNLKRELESISGNLNQAIQQLNKQPPPAEWKDAIDFLASEEFALREKIDEIKNVLTKTYTLWSQK